MDQKETQHLSHSTPDLHIYRDISLLEFHRRVLELARDKKTPLLGRVKFLAIFGSNMDVFFMLCMSGIHRRMASTGSRFFPPNENHIDDLTAVRSIVRELYTSALSCLHSDPAPRLKKEGIQFLEYSRLTKHQKQRAYKYFKKTIFHFLFRYMRDKVLATYLRDNQLAYLMLPNGRYEHKIPARGEQPHDVQNKFMHLQKRS